jgi:hypothetical protein
MANGKPPSALRITEAPAEIPIEEAAPEGGTITLVGPDREAFKAALGHECKPGDKYTVELTATEVTPEAIAFSIDNVESDYEEEPVPTGEEDVGAPAPASKPAAMTYA